MEAAGGWDVIGDVHGQRRKLERLLAKLGYAHADGAWRHPGGRRALFLGDVIDRGPEQAASIALVRAMQEAGSALCIMGNHEWNALRFDRGLRPLKSRDAHWSFLKQAPHGSRDYGFCLEWCASLPLWLDMGEFLAVHACPDAKSMRLLKKRGLPESAVMNEEMLRLAGTNNAVRNAVKTLLAGREAELPEGAFFTDKDGQKRTRMRVKWWLKAPATCREAAFMADVSAVPEVPPKHALKGEPPDRPVFIGHYWLSPQAALAPQDKFVACLDYSAGKGGPLAAYRWNEGDAELLAERFAAVQ